MLEPPIDDMEICPACSGAGVGVADTQCGLCGGCGGVPAAVAQGYRVPPMTQQRDDIVGREFAPCPTCGQYSHSIGEDAVTAAFNHFQMLICENPMKAYPTGHLFQAQTRDAAQVLIAEITRLRATVARVQGAAKTIMIGEADELRRLRERHREWHLAIQSLDSERDANAILTEENERLRAENAEAEQRGARAMQAAALKALKTAQYDPAPYTKGKYAIQSIDPTKLEGLEHG